jgi:Domain of unknown function (DUF4260)
VPRRLPHALLRLEGAALAAGALVLYVREDFGLLLLLVLALAPDISFLGYLAGARAGAAAYNGLHATVGPLALGVTGVLTGTDLAVQLALVWLAHIGFDRLLGYGLKYPESFRETHLQRV